MSKLILIRHGQSKWNVENKFTGWVDVDLSLKGEQEARESGALINNLNIKIDKSFTSYLLRAIKTLEIALKTMKNENKYEKAWELNERHYGALTGLNKDETKKKIGEEKFKIYRRSWNIAPPKMLDDDDNKKNFGELNLKIPKEKIPSSESLEDTYKRVVPYYENKVIGHLKLNKNVIISAHGNSLRALCKYLFNISNEKINKLEIPTGNPFLINLDKELKIKNFRYLNKERSKEVIDI
tara:strand:- start:412 stop:1128 length:717 start_codon:yes stop_codon:yes gene_type:complete